MPRACPSFDGVPTPEGSTPTGIDGDAPVLARHEIAIQAPLETIWQLHIAVNEWPTWQPDITEARLDEDFVPGASFDWTSSGLSVTSTIYDVSPPTGDVSPRARTLWGGTAVDLWIHRRAGFRVSHEDVASITTMRALGIAAKLVLWTIIFITALVAGLTQQREPLRPVAGVDRSASTVDEVAHSPSLALVSRSCPCRRGSASST